MGIEDKSDLRLAAAERVCERLGNLTLRNLQEPDYGALLKLWDAWHLLVEADNKVAAANGDVQEGQP